MTKYRDKYNSDEPEPLNLSDEVETRRINRESIHILSILLKENPKLKEILKRCKNVGNVKKEVRAFVNEYLYTRQNTLDYFNGDITGREIYNELNSKDIAAIRILDYINHEGKEYHDLNIGGNYISSRPFRQLWLAVCEGTGGAEPAFFNDMLFLFRQFNGILKVEIPSVEKVKSWMDRHPSGLDPELIAIRKRNKDRIIGILIKLMDDGDILRPKFRFGSGMDFDSKYRQMLEWWNDKTFHLQFAAGSPERLNKLLGRRVDKEKMRILFSSQDLGIPFFVNPYYISLINVDVPEKLKYSDIAIKDYIFVSKELVDEFGSIVAWEKEDTVEPGKPNTAGWILPTYYNIYRRYPEVAILIPDTTGRACGGLCVSCQRMYDFQRGHLNFGLEELRAVERWWVRLPKLLQYFEKDAQLCDILITGGDALMSSDKSLKRILNEVYEMAINKIEANKVKPEGKKYAEMLRVRLGTRLPVYIPQRITTSLVKILTDFRRKARKIGIKQFIIQTHFESAMEITPEAAEAVRKLISAGWVVTNQLVFTTAASRRGHTAKLRKVLNDIGIITYYTFSVKGFRENRHNFATNARAVQEELEEKILGKIPEDKYDKIDLLARHPEKMIYNIDKLRKEFGISFLATDRNVMNLPGIGKSLCFRTIGITFDGRRILEFEHDTTRNHSPIINKMGKVTIIESKSIGKYLEQLSGMGENLQEYESIWTYSIGEIEPRFALFNYPPYNYQVTTELTNHKV